MYDLEVFLKSALCPNTGVTFWVKEEGRSKRLIIQTVGNQLLLFKNK